MKRKNHNDNFTTIHAGKSPARPKTPIFADFGNYLRTLRLARNLTIKQIALDLNLHTSTIANIEKGFNPPPSVPRLKLWMRSLGEYNRINEAISLLHSVKTVRRVRYIPRHPVNEHLDRLLDCYESGRITEADIRLIQMVAPNEYKKYRDQSTKDD